MSMEEAGWGAVFPGIEASSSALQYKFPPFSAKSAHAQFRLQQVRYDTEDVKRHPLAPAFPYPPDICGLGLTTAIEQDPQNRSTFQLIYHLLKGIV
jgi:hypothetical protein